MPQSLAALRNKEDGGGNSDCSRLTPSTIKESTGPTSTAAEELCKYLKAFLLQHHVEKPGSVLKCIWAGGGGINVPQSFFFIHLVGRPQSA